MKLQRKNKRFSKEKTLKILKIIGISLAVIFALGLIGSLFAGNSGGDGVRAPSVNRPNKNDGAESTVPDVPDDSDEPSDSATESESIVPGVPEDPIEPDEPVSLSMKSAAIVDNFDTYVSPDNLKYLLDVELNGKKLSYGVGAYELREEANGTPYLRIYGDGTSSEAFAYVKDFNGDSYYGRYLAFAYRLPKTSTTTTFDVYASSVDVPAGQGDYFSIQATRDNEWHVVFVDMLEAIRTQKNVLNGTYTNKLQYDENNRCYVYRLRFDFFNNITPTDEYIDVAYIGLKENCYYNFDLDYTGAEFDAEYFAKYHSYIATLKNDNGMPYVTITDTTLSTREKSVTLTLGDSILPNVDNYIGILYRNAPGGAVQILNSYDNSNWSESKYYTYDTSEGWHFVVVRIEDSIFDSGTFCRRLRFDYFNNLTANTEYSIDIASVKSFRSEDHAYAYFSNYLYEYGLMLE